MRTYRDTTTHRLDEFARRLGLVVEVVIGEPSEGARYFVANFSGKLLQPPLPLGWTDEQAEHSLHLAAADPAWLAGHRDM